jgi:hypothetical protein
LPPAAGIEGEGGGGRPPPLASPHAEGWADARPAGGSTPHGTLQGRLHGMAAEAGLQSEPDELEAPWPRAWWWPREPPPPPPPAARATVSRHDGRWWSSTRSTVTMLSGLSCAQGVEWGRGGGGGGRVFMCGGGAG